MPFKEISSSELSFNPFDKISHQWYLITSGELSNYNTMTASWGTMGVFWNKPVVNCFVRPQRYTFEFMENNDTFTLSFFDEKYRSALNFCGSHSGRDVDKAAECNLTAVSLGTATAFSQANLVFVCKKLYSYDIKPEQMIDTSIDDFYPTHDYHRCYFGEILQVFEAC